MTEEKTPTYKCRQCKAIVNQKRDYEGNCYFIPKGRLCDTCASYEDHHKQLEALKKQPLCVKCEEVASIPASSFCGNCLKEKIAAVSR